MAIITNDADEGLVTSLLMYIGAVVAVAVVIGTPVWLLNMPTQFESSGMAGYQAPPGTRLLPDRRRVELPARIATNVSIVTTTRR